MDKFIVMGTPGSGKSTQAGLLARAYDFTRISVGEILRWQIQSHTKLGARVRRAVSAGQLVPDDVVYDLVHRRLDEHDWNYGFVLDGFPRNRAQAELFLESYDVNAVVHIDIPDEVVLLRVMSRRLCKDCGLDYNLIQHRPAVADACDICGGPLVTRADDTPEAVRGRLHDYHTKTRPILELFREQGLVLDVDGARSPEEIQAGLRAALNLSEPPSAPTAAPARRRLAAASERTRAVNPVR